MSIVEIIFAEVKCPVTGKISKNQVTLSSGCGVYGMGAEIPYFKEHHSDENLWVKSDGMCYACIDLMDEKYPEWRLIRIGEMKPKPLHGEPKYEEYHHRVFLNIKFGILEEVISEQEFTERSIKEYHDESEFDGLSRKIF